FVLHAALLHQAFAHCGRFLTAASRRSLGRVSVPVWLIILSDQLRIVGLVSHYLTNNLIRRRPLPKRPKTLIRRPYAVLATLSGSYSSLWGTFPRVTQPSAARRHLSQPSPFCSRIHYLGLVKSESIHSSVSRTRDRKSVV